MKNIDSVKKPLFSTSYAHVYETIYQNNEALIFSFHPQLVRCPLFQKGLQEAKAKYHQIEHTNKMHIYTWNTEFCITEKVVPWHISSMSHYERLCYKKHLFSIFEHIHKRSIHHGSLHPEFLFIRSNKSLAVMGWSFSQEALPMIQIYRPPQKYNTNGDMDSDRYAIALLTYELISRRKPWESRCTRYEIQKRKEKPLLRPLTAFGFSQQKSVIFMKALSPDQSSRFETLKDFSNTSTEQTSTSNHKEESITIGTVPQKQFKLHLSKNQQNLSLSLFFAMLVIFIGFYESSARAGNTSWKYGYSTRNGTKVVQGDSLGMSMITIPDGVYQSQHIHGFLISQTEVTEKQWSSIMNSYPSNSQRPKTNITWLDTIYFCNALSLLNNKDPVYYITENDVQYDPNKNGYRLPTAQEWEYAAQGTEQSRYSGSNDLDSVAWSSSNTKGRVQQVKRKKPNDYGVFDMTGNVAEWVFTKHTCLGNICPINSTGWIKGGSISSSIQQHQIRIRTPLHREIKQKDVGFRIIINDNTQ